MPERYPRRTEALVVVKGTQVAARVCDGGAVAGIYHFPVQRNTLYLQVCSGEDDTALEISYRMLYKMGGSRRIVKDSELLHSGSYISAIDGILSYPIQVYHGCNDVEVTLNSANGVTGYVEGLWLDVGANVGAEYMAEHGSIRPDSEPVAAGGREIIQIAAPPGYIGQVHDIKIWFGGTGAATTGKRTVSVYVGTMGSGQIKGEFAYYRQPTFLYGAWREEAQQVLPISENAQADAMRSLCFDDTKRLCFEHINDTDTPSVFVRQYSALVRYRRVR